MSPTVIYCFQEYSYITKTLLVFKCMSYIQECTIHLTLAHYVLFKHTIYIKSFPVCLFFIFYVIFMIVPQFGARLFLLGVLIIIFIHALF